MTWNRRCTSTAAGHAEGPRRARSVDVLAGGQPAQDVWEYVKRPEVRRTRLNDHGRAWDTLRQPPGVPTGDRLSLAPCQSRTGMVTVAGSNPHELCRARSSSIQPCADVRSASA